MRWIALLILMLHAPTSWAQSPATDNVLDEIVSIVGDKLILRSEVDGLLLSFLQQQQQPYRDELWLEALNQLIDQKVLAEHARRDTTIQVSDDRVNQTLDERLNQLMQQVGGQARLEALYGKTLTQLRAELREDFREQMLAETFRNRKLQQIHITPSEVRAWFARFPTDSLPTLPDLVRLSHIVRYPRPSEAARQEAFEIAAAIRDSIVSGRSSFEAMARRFSEDPGSASAGGHIPDTRLGDLVPEFAAVASRIPIGEISQPFETPFGVHILRVNRRQGDVIDFHHILIRIDDSQADPAPAIAYLKAIRDSILTYNLPFGLMARRHSEEASTGPQGGRIVDPRTSERDLVRSALDPTWQRTIDTLQVGEISHPTEAVLLDGRRAYHIVRLDAHIPSHRVSLETDYARIEQLALQDKRNRVMRQWLNELRRSVVIQLHGKAQALAERYPDKILIPTLAQR
jgi:peptidyl-prolyl cis-trans isomerase SurA